MIKKILVPVTALGLLLVTMTSSALQAHEGREVEGLQLVVGFMVEPAYEGQPNGALIRISKVTEDGAPMEGSSHGGLFGSGTVAAGGSYSFEFTHDLEDQTVPFHDHLTGHSGSVTVSHDGTDSGTVMVTFGNDGFSPSELHIQPGATVMFMNQSPGVMSVVSGPADGSSGETDSHSETVPVLNAADALRVEILHVPTDARLLKPVRAVFGEDGTYVADFIPTSPGVYSFRFFGEVDGVQLDETFTSGPSTFDEIAPATSLQFPVELASPRELQSAVQGIQDSLAAAEDNADSAKSSATLGLVVGSIGLAAGLIGLVIGSLALASSRKK
jgi:plastocyanin